MKTIQSLEVTLYARPCQVFAKAEGRASVRRPQLVGLIQDRGKQPPGASLLPLVQQRVSHPTGMIMARGHYRVYIDLAIGSLQEAG